MRATAAKQQKLAVEVQMVMVVQEVETAAD